MGEAGERAGSQLLRKAESLAYWLEGAAGGIPAASLAYRVACWRGDWTSRSWPEKRSEMMDNLRQVLGDELTLN